MIRAYADFVAYKELRNYVRDMESGTFKTNEDTIRAMKIILTLFGLDRLSKDLSNMMELGFYKGEHLAQFRTLIPKACSDFKKYAIPFIESASPFEEVVDSMIAPQDGRLYDSIVSKVFSAPGAFERIRNWKDLYQS